MKIAVILEPCEEGGFTASIPTLPGCISEGDTVEEALANIREAFELLIEPTEDDLIVGEQDRIEALLLDWSAPEPIESSPAALSGVHRHSRPTILGVRPQSSEPSS